MGLAESESAYRFELKQEKHKKKNQLPLLGCFSVKPKLNNGDESRKPRGSRSGYENGLYIGVV